MSNTRKTAATRRTRIDSKDVFDLDALERPERAKPFRFNLAGRTFTLTDPIDIPYAEVAKLRGGTVGDLEATTWVHLLGDQYEDWQTAMAESGIELWRMDALYQAFQKHYDLPSPGEADASSIS